MASEKSPGTHRSKGLLELECPILNSTVCVSAINFPSSSPLSPLLKISVKSVAHKCLGWSEENHDKEVSLNPGWHREKERRVTGHETRMSIGVVESGTINHK